MIAPVIVRFHDVHGRTLRDFRQYVLDELKVFRKQLGPQKWNVHFATRIKTPYQTQMALLRWYSNQHLPLPEELSLAEVIRIVPDLIGLRVVCRFADLVYPLVIHLLNDPRLRLADKDDFPEPLKWFRWTGLGREKEAIDLIDSVLNIRIPAVERYSGYASFHVLVQRGDHRTPDDYALAAEIQVRSALEDIWGELEHQTYNTRVGKGHPSAWETGASLEGDFRGLQDLFLLAGRRVDQLRNTMGRARRFPDMRTHELKEQVLAPIQEGQKLEQLLADAHYWYRRCQPWRNPITRLDRAVGAAPPFQELHACAFALCQWLLRYSKAFDHVADGVATRLDLLAEAAFLFYASGDRATAAWLYERILGEDERHFFANWRMATLAYEDGLLTDAIAHASRALGGYERNRAALASRFKELPSRTEITSALLYFEYEVYEVGRDWEPSGASDRLRHLVGRARDAEAEALAEDGAGTPLHARAANWLVWLSVQEDRPDWDTIDAVTRRAQLAARFDERGWRAAAYLDTLAIASLRRGRLKDALAFSLYAKEIAACHPETLPRIREAIEATFQMVSAAWREGAGRGQ